MKERILLAALAFVLFAGGCAATKERAGRQVFSFAYGGDTYEIVSVVARTGRGANYLIRRDGGQVLLRLKDADQDGTLDTLLTGTVTLSHASAIYAAGIAEAASRGRLARHAPVLVYELYCAGKLYAVQTYALGPERWYNQFVIYDPATQAEVVFLDADADGTLDKPEKGTNEPEEGQQAYEMVLEGGVREGRIEKDQNRYAVKPEGARVSPDPCSAQQAPARGDPDRPGAGTFRQNGYFG